MMKIIVDTNLWISFLIGDKGLLALKQHRDTRIVTLTTFTQ